MLFVPGHKLDWILKAPKYGPDALLCDLEDAVPVAEKELVIRTKSGAPLNVADARTDLGLALIRSGRDVARGKALLREAREGLVAGGKTSRLESIDAALGLVSGAPPR